MQIGGIPLDDRGTLLTFIACLAAALALVYLFCQKKFAEPSSMGSSDYVDQMMPRYLATKQEYSKGFLMYFGTMAATVLLLSLIGPNNLGVLGIEIPKGIGYAAVPLATALVLVGLMPTVPILLELEKWLRKAAHERAYIPTAARATAQRLAAADFDFMAYRDLLQQPELRGVEPGDFTHSRRSLEHDWARLSCLVYEQKSRRTAGILDSLDADLLSAYARDLENIEHTIRGMAADVATYRREIARDPSYTNDALRGAIRDNLHKLYILLGCAVRLKVQPSGDIDLALRQFGFKLNQKPASLGNEDLKLVGLSVVAVSVLLLEFVATGIGRLAGRLELWSASLIFPQTWFQPFIDTATWLIPHCAAIIMADLMRQRAIKKGTWFRAAPRNSHMLSAKHIRVAVVCGIAGYVSLILWGFVFLTPDAITAKGLLVDVPNSLIAMVTGGFYVAHLDNVEMNRRPSRKWELGLQAAITGIVGLIAATAYVDLILKDVPVTEATMALDKIILATACAIVTGLALAWYIPAAATMAKSDPLTEAKEERISLLETAVRERFGNPATVAEWLNTRHPALGDKSPRDSAADVEGLERALTLLHRPQALAA
jgi:Protein of unknown function (DUF2384)